MAGLTGPPPFCGRLLLPLDVIARPAGTHVVCRNRPARVLLSMGQGTKCGGFQSNGWEYIDARPIFPPALQRLPLASNEKPPTANHLRKLKLLQGARRGRYGRCRLAARQLGRRPRNTRPSRTGPPGGDRRAQCAGGWFGRLGQLSGSDILN